MGNGHACVIQGEIVRVCAGAETIQTEINRIRPIFSGGEKGFDVACRGQQLRFFM